MTYPVEDHWSDAALPSAQARPGAATGVLQYRRSEGHAPFFRSDRYFTVGHEWYVTKREGGHLGPYLSRDEAERALAKHVAVLLQLDGQTERLLDPPQGGPATAFEGLVRTVLERWRPRGSAGASDTSSTAAPAPDEDAPPAT